MADRRSEPPAPGPAGSHAPALSWHEREVLDALRRVARAQAQVAALTGPAPVATVPTIDPADVQRLHELQAELDKARARAAGRFAKGATRERVDELEMAERLVLDRLGASTTAEVLARSTAAPPAVPQVDPVVLDFARRELAAARTAWIELQAMDMPEVEEESDEPLGRSDTPEVPSHIDLTERAPMAKPDVA